MHFLQEQLATHPTARLTAALTPTLTPTVTVTLNPLWHRRCFGKVRFLSANLTETEDLYRPGIKGEAHGPNNMFYRIPTLTLNLPTPHPTPNPDPNPNPNPNTNTDPNPNTNPNPNPNPNMLYRIFRRPDMSHVYDYMLWLEPDNKVSTPTLTQP